MNQIIRSLMSRKSVRSFTDQEIPEDIIQVILKASVVSFDAHLNHSYVGNIINFKKTTLRGLKQLYKE